MQTRVFPKTGQKRQVRTLQFESKNTIFVPKIQIDVT